jgi:hypothetical protein
MGGKTRTRSGSDPIAQQADASTKESTSTAISPLHPAATTIVDQADVSTIKESTSTTITTAACSSSNHA